VIVIEFLLQLFPKPPRDLPGNQLELAAAAGFFIR